MILTDMTIMRLGDLRDAIRAALCEDFYTRNVTAPASADREQLKRISARDIEPDEIADHLRDPTAEIEDDEGPVPRKAENTPRVSSDPYVKGAGAKM
jgi:hypothetical protein